MAIIAGFSEGFLGAFHLNWVLGLKHFRLKHFSRLNVPKYLDGSWISLAWQH